MNEKVYRLSVLNATPVQNLKLQKLFHKLAELIQASGTAEKHLIVIAFYNLLGIDADLYAINRFLRNGYNREYIGKDEPSITITHLCSELQLLIARFEQPTELCLNTAYDTETILNAIRNEIISLRGSHRYCAAVNLVIKTYGAYDTTLGDQLSTKSFTIGETHHILENAIKNGIRPAIKPNDPESIINAKLIKYVIEPFKIKLP